MTADIEWLSKQALNLDTKATAGPWRWGQGDFWEPVSAEEHRDGIDGTLMLLTEWTDEDDLEETIAYVDDILNKPEDAEFIVFARTALPAIAKAYLDQQVGIHKFEKRTGFTVIEK